METQKIPFCFNCGDRSHVSKWCPEKPKYNRCPVCDNVCFKEDGHKLFCTNQSFVSALLAEDDDPIAKITEFLQMEFSFVDAVVVHSERGDKTIDETPLWFRNNNIQLRAKNGAIVFEASRSEKRTITIIDQNGRRRMKLTVCDSWLVVNEYYNLSSYGVIKYNRRVEQNQFGNGSCELKVYINDVFEVHIKWNGFIYSFKSYSNGVILVDPNEAGLRGLPKQFVENSNQTEDEIRIFDGSRASAGGCSDNNQQNSVAKSEAKTTLTSTSIKC